MTIKASDVVDWAVGRWQAEVANRPLQNMHRRSLDGTWRQVIRHFGGDAVILCGPAHDDLLRASPLSSDKRQGE
jgi:hypothetical protein